MSQPFRLPTTRSARRRAGGPHDERVADAIHVSLRDGLRTEGEQYGVIVLTAATDPDTVQLAQPIANDTTAKTTGRAWAWTLGQRYTSLAKLRRGRRDQDQPARVARFKSSPPEGRERSGESCFAR